MRLLDALVLPACAALLVAGCGSGDSADSAAGGASAGTALTVAAGFYPLQYLVEQVGGDRVEVTLLTPPGSEPHDSELTPDSLVALQDADLVVYQARFQPSVDDALADRSGGLVDVSSLATRPVAPGTDEAEEGGDTDPHFWNDPTLYAGAARLVADALSTADPDGAETYAANTATLMADLTAIDTEAQAALGSCTITALVTAHHAFGYFADRYGFEAVSIAGIDPAAEPSASDLADVTEVVKAEGVTTIYTETLVSPDVAETVAAETGAATAVLDPIEGITDESPGTDYPSIMRANIDAVAAGQDCG